MDAGSPLRHHAAAYNLLISSDGKGMQMDWQERIHSDPKILRGKPVIRGTRISVELLLGLLASGWTKEQIFESYPHVTEDDLRAVFAFAAEIMSDYQFFRLPA